MHNYRKTQKWKEVLSGCSRATAHSPARPAWGGGSLLCRLKWLPKVLNTGMICSHSRRQNQCGPEEAETGGQRVLSSPDNNKELTQFNNNWVTSCYLPGDEEEAKTSSSFNCRRNPAGIHNAEIQSQENAQAVMKTPDPTLQYGGNHLGQTKRVFLEDPETGKYHPDSKPTDSEKFLSRKECGYYVPGTGQISRPLLWWV